ncbi:MAG: 4-alpha-glucanotransferase [Bacteroidetes bacterium GWF2_43_63]|nr:MAG: 4-alpha-glucanotransferase [Bacteroidetes bacterium GWE2_42_42]OFY55503.1 MAG: 4-alpha-glucanotransferase [Bacteroidetes bacterium GWF2_43_63]HBG69980.1 4-alpha-glucanotransferase [Bacteroidales bacterium]HCB62595.1 4-alpha-glucanotransferase [Bacteroidales bacterium]HCY23715.1 4-alpha-glucanotransferase [Bacteroidales bacterium]
MKVLMFGWEFPPHITGGLGTACLGLTRSLARMHTDVLFVVPRAFGDEDTSMVNLVNASDVEVDLEKSEYSEFWKRIQYMSVASDIIPYVGPVEYSKTHIKNLKKEFHSNSIFSHRYTFSGSYGNDLMFEVSRYALIASGIAAKNNFDIIHAHDWLTYPAGIAAKQVSGKPLVIHVHATEFDRSGEHVNQRVFEIEREGMMQADRVITVSNLTRNIVIERYGINPDKVFTVYNGADAFQAPAIEHIDKPFPEKVVTFLGRITFQKGPDYFVEAAKKVLEKDENVRFVMAGSGDMLPRIVRMVSKHRMGHKFHFTGFLKGNDVDKMFSYSDVYVMPSVSEPFGISPLEAMRSSVPVVISRQSGVAEVLRHALKVDFWDVDAMADSIYGLLNYPALSRMFSRFGRNEVEDLKWDNAAASVLSIYQQLV